MNILSVRYEAAEKVRQGQMTLQMMTGRFWSLTRTVEHVFTEWLATQGKLDTDTRKEDASAFEVAKQALLEILKDDPVPALEVIEKARERGIKLGTLRRAKDFLAVQTRKVGKPKGQWVWKLPPGVTIERHPKLGVAVGPVTVVEAKPMEEISEAVTAKAVKFVYEALLEGPVRLSDLTEAAQAAGFTHEDLILAKREICPKVNGTWGGGRWDQEWTLSDDGLDIAPAKS